METTFQTLIEIILPIVVIAFAYRIMFRTYAKVFKGTPIGRLFKKADEAPGKIYESYKDSRAHSKAEKRRKKIDKGEIDSGHVQVKFGSNHSKLNKQEERKSTSGISVDEVKWDIPDINDIGKDEPLAKHNGQSRIKSFEEFKKANETLSEASKEAATVLGNAHERLGRVILPDMLRVDLPNADILTCDPQRGDFYLNDDKMGANIPNVYSLRSIGRSRIDGMPIVQIRAKGEKKTILVKVNKIKGQFELISNIENHVRAKYEPEPSNIDDWWNSGSQLNTVNSKFQK